MARFANKFERDFPVDRGLEYVDIERAYLRAVEQLKKQEIYLDEFIDLHGGGRDFK